MDKTAFKLDTAPAGSMRVDAVVNGPVSTDTYFVVSGDEALVIDPAWDGEELARRFSSMHPDVKVKALVCTHCHADHVGGVAGMRRAFGGDVPYLISRVDAPRVEEAVRSMRAMWGIDTELPGEPDRLLDEGDRVEVGGIALQVVSTPGHTPGGIALFAATEDGNIAFMGDTLFPGSAGRTDLEGGDAQTLLGSLAKLSRLIPADTLCLCGHEDPTTMERELERNPYIADALAQGL